MQKTLTSNLKVTTIWPELANHRIQTLDSQLEEVRVEPRDAFLKVEGIIHRKVVCLNRHNQCRKFEDRLQFVTNLALSRESFAGELAPPFEPAPLIEPAPAFEKLLFREAGCIRLEKFSLSNFELLQNDFIFQSRPGGEGPAVLEQSFRLIFHCPPVEPVLRRKALLVWAKRVIERGQGSLVPDLPVGLLGPTQTPRHFNGTIHIHSPVSPPVVSAVLKGVITYCSPEKELKEMEYETAIDFLLDRPLQLQGNQQLWVTGELIAAKWLLAPGGGWRLVIKLRYQWRLIEECELRIVMAEGGETRFPGHLENYALNIRLKKFDFQLSREYEFDNWSFDP
jgi:hypothetical protein